MSRKLHFYFIFENEEEPESQKKDGEKFGEGETGSDECREKHFEGKETSESNETDSENLGQEEEEEMEIPPLFPTSDGDREDVIHCS